MSTPELWIPADVRTRATALRKRIKKRADPLDTEHAHWREYVGERIAAHVREYLAEAERSRPPAPQPAPVVPDPGTWGTTKVIRQNGTPIPGGGMFVPYPEPTGVSADAQLVREIVSNPRRQWQAYLTLQAIATAHAEAAAAKAATADAEHAKRVLTCPICGDIPDSIGTSIRTRPLIAGPTLGPSPSVRSCSSCWATASTQYVTKLAGERTKDGRTRASAVAEHLQLIGR